MRKMLLEAVRSIWGKRGEGRGGVNDRSHCAANPRAHEANIFKNTLINIFMLRQQIFTGVPVINHINNARHAAVGEPAKSVVGQQLFHPHSISSPSPLLPHEPQKTPVHNIRRNSTLSKRALRTQVIQEHIHRKCIHQNGRRRRQW